MIKKVEINVPSIDNIKKGGTISIDIDEMVPCLLDNSNGKIVATEVSLVTDYSTLAKYNRKTGWDFNWGKPPKDTEVYALKVAGNKDIEGLIALRKEPKNSAVYMYWGNAAPHNRVTKSNSEKKYNGVGGHLFAIAADVSLKEGYGGFIYADAVNKELFDKFINDYGAIPINTRDRIYRFCFDGPPLINIIKTYNFDWR